MDKRTQAWWIIAGSVIFLGALLSAKVFITPQPVCDPNAKSKTVILLDHSDGVATQTSDVIVERAWQVIEHEVKDGEMVSVFSVSKLSKNDLKPSFAQCKPRQDGSRTTEDVKRLKREFEEKFKKPLRSELATPIEGSEESPIAQAIIDLSLHDTQFRSDSTRLIVFSDFLENTPGFSVYKCTDPDKAIEAFRASRLGAVERPSFRNVDVRMNIIPRHNVTKPMLKCRDKFWPWFFGDNKDCKHASCLTPDYLPG